MRSMQSSQPFRPFRFAPPTCCFDFPFRKGLCLQCSAAVLISGCIFQHSIGYRRAAAQGTVAIVALFPLQNREQRPFVRHSQGNRAGRHCRRVDEASRTMSIGGDLILSYSLAGVGSHLEPLCSLMPLEICSHFLVWPPIFLWKDEHCTTWSSRIYKPIRMELTLLPSLPPKRFPRSHSQRLAPFHSFSSSDS